MPEPESKLLSHMFAALIVCAGFAFLAPNICHAQIPGMAAAQADSIRQLRETGQYFREYAKKHDHFPNSTSEMDDSLQALFKKISMVSSDSRVTISSNGKYRTYFQFNIAVDPSWKTIPIVNNIPQMPSNFLGPLNGIVIMTDGNDEVVCLATDGGGNLLTSDGNNPLYEYVTIEPKEEKSPASGSDAAKEK